MNFFSITPPFGEGGRREGGFGAKKGRTPEGVRFALVIRNARMPHR